MTENGLIRPSHDESVEERTIPTDVDYPTLESELSEQFEEPIVTEPTPVYIVGIPPKEDVIIAFSSDRFTVQDDPVQCAGANRNRKSVSIVNHAAANAVYVGGNPQVSSEFSGKLVAGASLDLEHNSAVWVRCATGETAEISVFQEYTLAEE